MATKTFKVSLSLDNPRIIQTGIKVRSFDKQSIKIAIELIKDSQVYQIPTDAQIKISLLKLARQEQKIILDVPFTSTDSIDWIVPEYLDGYQGEVRVGVYLIVGTENIDVGYFNIASKVSDIDKAAEEFTDSVMQGWDQIEADLAEIRATITQVNTLASDFTTDVATKQADVTNKYNAFDTSVTQANQTIDDILALQPQFQAVLDETTGKDVISAPEIILARDGAMTLGERLEADKAEVTAQLAQTIRIDESNLSLNNFNEHDRAVIQGLAEGEINAVLGPRNVENENIAEKAITPEKTSFMDISQNMFNKDAVTLNKTIDKSGVEVYDDTFWLGNQYHSIETGETIALSGGAEYRIILYTADMTFQSRSGTSDGLFTNNSSVARFFRISGTTNVDDVMLNRGSVKLPYNQFHSTIKQEVMPFAKLRDHDVTPRKTTFFDVSKNLFDNSLVKKNKSYASDGSIESDALRWIYDTFIPVEKGDVLHFNSTKPFRVATYLANKDFKSRTGSIPTDEENIYTNTSSVVKFVKISGMNLVDIERLMVTKNEKLPFLPFGKEVIKSEFLPGASMAFDLEDLKEDILSEINVKYPFPPKLSLSEVYRGNARPLWLSRDGSVVFGHEGTKPLMSVDEWSTQQQIGQERLPRYINAIRELEDGQLLLSTNRDESQEIKAEVYKSSGFSRENPSLTTWHKVLETGSRLANVQNSWGMDIYENIVLISEYGLQGVDGSNYVYLSTDFGETYKQIFDLKTEVIPDRPVWTVDAHVHTVAYDPFYERIWLAVGDSANTAIYFSDDLGDSWTFVDGSNTVQHTGIIALPDCVVIGSDRAPNGLYIYRRKDKSKMPIFKEWHILNNDPTLTHIFQLPFRRKVGKDIPVYFPASSSKQTSDRDSTVIMGFVDGKKAHLLYESEKVHSISDGSGISCVLGDTAQGHVIVVNEEPSPIGRVVYKVQAPTWE